MVSTVVAASLAFLGNRFWTWRDRERTALHREYLLYFSFNLVGLLISAACSGSATTALGAVWPVLQTPLADNISGKVIGVGLASISGSGPTGASSSAVRHQRKRDRPCEVAAGQVHLILDGTRKVAGCVLTM